jgi:hypothetical protein
VCSPHARPVEVTRATQQANTANLIIPLFIDSKLVSGPVSLTAVCPTSNPKLLPSAKSGRTKTNSPARKIAISGLSRFSL